MISKVRCRTLMVMFECGRCGKRHIEPYEKQLKDTEGNLQCYKPPEGWQDDSLYTPMFCDKCAREYREFLQMLKGADNEQSAD
jgi:hypothetical protein